MVIENAKNRSSKKSGRDNRSKPKSESRTLGGVQQSSREHGTHSVGASGEDSFQGNIAVTAESVLSGISGKIASQLINETEKQLAYHEEQMAFHTQQVEALKKRVEELKQVSVFDE